MFLSSWKQSFLIALLSPFIQAQSILTVQNVTFNSSAKLTPAQISLAGIDSTTAEDVAIALNFERSNYATGLVLSDSFYSVPANASNTSTPGKLLKVDTYVNTSLFTLPPETALSRFLFTTETLNNTVVPASGYILWPFSPRVQPNGKIQAVVWAHGTTGEFGDCAPSHVRDLGGYNFAAPFTLVANGYVVVAPDYAGLGVNATADGHQIRHPYMASPAHANDLFFAVQAAQTAFPDSISEEFVVMGHSQGGGPAFAAAERQAVRPVKGYLGTVVGSPVGNITGIVDYFGYSTKYRAAYLAWGLQGIFPDFYPGDLLTEQGLHHLSLSSQIGGCSSVSSVLFKDKSNYQPNWTSTYYARSYQNMTVNGGKKVSGPMLILQGLEDTSVPVSVTDHAVNLTCSLFPESEIEYVRVHGVGHVEVLYATMRRWLDWIDEKFSAESEQIKKSCVTTQLESYMSVQNYQSAGTWFLEWADQAYLL